MPDLKEEFPHLNGGRVKEVIFVGSKIRVVMKDQNFTLLLERAVSVEAFDGTIHGRQNDIKLSSVSEQIFRKIHGEGGNTYFQIHVSIRILDLFHDKCGAVSLNGFNRYLANGG